MSSSGPKKLVINADRFLLDICPVVLQELGPDDEEPDDSPVGDAEFFRTIRAGGHKMILTADIEEEYTHRAQSFPTIAWLPVIQQMQLEGLVINPRLPSGDPNYQGIPQRHDTFPNTAIRANADYLITENPVWLDRYDTIAGYGPMVITPGRFVRQEGTTV